MNKESLLAVAALAVAISPTTAFSQCGPNGCYVQPSRPAPAAEVGPRLHPSIARIIHHEGSGASIGTGTLIHSPGGASFFVTCAHLFDGAGRTEVQLNGQSAPAKIVALDRAHDLALLQTPPLSGKPVDMADVESGGVLTACGFGSTGVLRCVRGPVMGRAVASGATAPSLRIRGAVRSGDSGGPVFNASGRLVAVIWGQQGGETYAMTGAPLRRIFERLPRVSRSPAPVERTPVEGKADGDDPWKRRIESQLDALAQRPQPTAPNLPDDVVRRDDLQALASQWDERMDQLVREVHVRGNAPATASFLEPLLAATAVGGPLGLALWFGRRMLRRSVKRRVAAATTCERSEARSVAVDSPPPPQQVVPETHYVSYERDDFALAHQWASEQLVRKFPGAVEVLTSLDSLIKQQLNGKG